MNESLDPLRLPRHVGIIMDGNGRWAKSRGLPRLWGHREGTERVREIVETAGRVGIKALTLYTFSTENWSRAEREIRGLMVLLSRSLRKQTTALNSQRVRLKTIGRWEALPLNVRRELNRSMNLLKNNEGLTLTLALNYGGRQEIVDAVKRTLEAGEPLSEESLSRHLDTAPLPDPDLIIRTSGEFRLSNFLLWQAAYTEFFVTPVLWPDFNSPQFINALLDYQRRDRRFGSA